MATITEATLDFIYEHTKSATEAQEANGVALDGKGFQLMTAASIVVGISGLVTQMGTVPKMAGYLLLGAVISFILSALLTLLGVRISRFRTSLQADVLWQEYWNLEPKEIKHALVDDISKAYEYNKRKMFQKASFLRWAFILSSVEVALVGAAFVIAILS